MAHSVTTRRYGSAGYASPRRPLLMRTFAGALLILMCCCSLLQALITGAFSMVYQSMAMGCFPRFKVHHTSEEVGGQIFIPEVR